MIKSLKSGFTLAEVLTTLMVIGVVAAMTIPTLMNGTDDQQSKVAYKKAMSVLSQGVQLLEAREEECSDAAYDWDGNPGEALAACMHNVLSGNLNGDTISTPDGMVFKFFAVDNGSESLPAVCGSGNFASDADSWKGAFHCGVEVDVNGLGKGTKEFEHEADDFTAMGFDEELDSKDQFQLSLSSTGVRPVYFGDGNDKGYEYMYGKIAEDDDGPVAGICCQMCTENGAKKTKSTNEANCNALGAGWQACNANACD